MLLTTRRNKKTPEHATMREPRRLPLWPIAVGGLAALAVALVGVLLMPANPQSLQVSTGSTNSAPAGPEVVVTRVVDGDTVEVTGPLAATVQVLGIDAPEYPGGACWAKESRDFAARTLDGKTVTVVSDPSQPAVDKRGRTLGYLRLADGSDYSVRAAAGGMVTYYDDGQAVSSRGRDQGRAGRGAERQARAVGPAVQRRHRRVGLGVGRRARRRPPPGGRADRAAGSLRSWRTGFRPGSSLHSMRGRAGRAAAAAGSGPPPRKVRTPQGRVVANGNPG